MIAIGREVREGTAQCHEQWDGKGGPRGLRREQLSLAARVFHVAHFAELFNRVGGLDVALRVVRQRAGKQFDPHVVESFGRVGPPLLRRLDATAAWDAVLAAEPPPIRWLSDEAFDRIAQAIANFVDMRSPFTLGHSVGVAALAETAARGLELSEPEARALRQAGLLHDLGRTGVPVAIWNKTGPLTAQDWERVKRHPALTELVLARSAALGHLGTLAGLHHERLDGSGYRRVHASFLPLAAQVLAAADTYRTRIERRPHRAALAPAVAADALRTEARAGRFDSRAVEAVLAAAGHIAPRATTREWPAGLSQREVEVLRLAIRGLSNRQIADTLVVSPKTVGHHIQHIYDKIGVSTRVGATLFALHHGLIEDGTTHE